MAFLEVRDVSVDYPIVQGLFQRKKGVFRAVDRVSFDLEEGGIMALVGQSGSGKTTLANAILGLQPVSGGSIRLDGVPVEEYRFQGRVQAVFQNPYSSLNPRMSVRNIVSEPYRHIHPRASREEVELKTRETLHKVGISEPDAVNRFPHEFSGGQRQRISLARALISDPRIILLDEPVSSLDVSIRAQILNLLARLREELGLTFIYISHDLATVRFLSRTILVIRHGRMIEAGDTRSVYQNPAHPYTRLLLDSARDIILDQPLQETATDTACGEDYPSARAVEDRHVVYCS